MASPAPGHAEHHYVWLWVTLTIIAAVVVVMLAGAVAYLVITRAHAARDHRRQARTAQLALWDKGDRAMKGVAAELMAFEMPDTADAILDSLFARPLLGDTREPASARFYEAYAGARRLWLEVVPADQDSIQKFVDAALDAEQAWQRANDNAREKAALGIVSDGRKLTRGEQKAMRTARDMFALALDTGASPLEAQTAERKAHIILAALVRIPAVLDRHVTQAITTVHRLALPAAAEQPTQHTAPDPRLFQPLPDDVRDNFRRRVSMRRLSPRDAARMLWDLTTPGGDTDQLPDADRREGDAGKGADR